MSLQAICWVLSPSDFMAHAVSDADSDAGGLVARCGHRMPRAAGLDRTPRASLCRACAIATIEVVDLGGWGGPP